MCDPAFEGFDFGLTEVNNQRIKPGSFAALTSIVFPWFWGWVT